MKTYIKLAGHFCTVASLCASAFEIDGVRNQMPFQEVVNVLSRQGYSQLTQHTAMGTAYSDSGITAYGFGNPNDGNRGISAAFCKGALTTYQATTKSTIHEFAICVDEASKRTKQEPRMLSTRYGVVPPAKHSSAIVAMFKVSRTDEMACIYGATDTEQGTLTVRFFSENACDRNAEQQLKGNIFHKGGDIWNRLRAFPSIPYFDISAVGEQRPSR